MAGNSQRNSRCTRASAWNVNGNNFDGVHSNVATACEAAKEKGRTTTLNRSGKFTRGRSKYFVSFNQSRCEMAKRTPFLDYLRGQCSATVRRFRHSGFMQNMRRTSRTQRVFCWLALPPRFPRMNSMRRVVHFLSFAVSLRSSNKVGEKWGTYDATRCWCFGVRWPIHPAKRRRLTPKNGIILIKFLIKNYYLSNQRSSTFCRVVLLSLWFFFRFASTAIVFGRKCCPLALAFYDLRLTLNCFFATPRTCVPTPTGQKTQWWQFRFAKWWLSHDPTMLLGVE